MMTDEDGSDPTEVDALIEAIVDGRPLCPYYLAQVTGVKRGLPGSYGPDTCNMGCCDEPSCITCGPFALGAFPALAERLASELMERYDDDPSTD